MNRFFMFFVITATLGGCKKSETFKDQKNASDDKQSSEVQISEAEVINEPSDFIPEGYKIFEKIKGDLNKDGVEDLVLVIKGTDKKEFVTDENRGILDRNRRGILILFKTKNSYELAVKNYDCFSSENEDGGVYFPPDLMISIEKGNLYINYGHGRYGYWEYTFRYKKSDFYLIGYDSSSHTGPIVDKEISINFLTNKKRIAVNANNDAESGEEVFNETWETINPYELKLSTIIDFDELDIPDQI